MIAREAPRRCGVRCSARLGGRSSRECPRPEVSPLRSPSPTLPRPAAFPRADWPAAPSPAPRPPRPPTRRANTDIRPVALHGKGCTRSSCGYRLVPGSAGIGGPYDSSPNDQVQRPAQRVRCNCWLGLKLPGLPRRLGDIVMSPFPAQRVQSITSPPPPNDPAQPRGGTQRAIRHRKPMVPPRLLQRLVRRLALADSRTTP